MKFAFHPGSQLGFFLAILGLGFLGILDYVTGYELGFFVFYFIPIGFVSWNARLTYGMIMAILCAFTWFLVDVLSGLHYSSLFYLYWNTGIRLVSYFIVAYGLTEIHRILEKERLLNRELTQALSQVKQLSGLLPVCASCKKIRNDKGYWEQMEQYVSSHSEASFSHGICPECMETLYPEIALKRKQKAEE